MAVVSPILKKQGFFWVEYNGQQDWLWFWKYSILLKKKAA
jgi:hypothetical protein